MLANTPHRNVHDLSVVYYFIVTVGENKSGSIRIHSELADRLKLTEEQLFELAMENTKRIFPPMVTSMDEMIRTIYRKNEIHDDELEDMLEESHDVPLYIISNTVNMYGAVNLLYQDILQQLAEFLESDLYILPSSIHELLVTCTAEVPSEKLAHMVAEVNENEVDLEDRLSNHVYYYGRKTGKIEMAN